MSATRMAVMMLRFAAVRQKAKEPRIEGYRPGISGVGMLG